MVSEQRHKRRHMLGVSLRSLFLYLSFFLFLFFFFFSSSHHYYSFAFHPSLASSTFPLLYSSNPRSILQYPSTTSLSLQHRILFPDHVLLTLSNPYLVFSPHELLCVYHNLVNGSAQEDPVFDVQLRPVLSTDRFDEFRSIARCRLPWANFSFVSLSRHRDSGRRSFYPPEDETARSWDKLAYEAVLDDDTVIVFVKGLNLRPHRVSDPTRLMCHFRYCQSQNGAFRLTAKAVSVAQEVVRCSLPESIRNKPDKAHGLTVTVSHLSRHVRNQVPELMPSVARIRSFRKNRGKKFKLCACTMVWNQARAIREWVMYHGWLGVERWYIYDNNSDDDTERVVNELDREGYNVSREIWPWIKSQEAGFSHCSLRAKEECEWVGFFDVDEFFYFPNDVGHNSLISLVSNFSSSKSIAEIRTGCRNFGPSGLKSHPEKGVTVGYTCRLQSSERHKSIVRPELLHTSLLNVVHHFELREGFRYRNMDQSIVVINHYKYQVWEKFKAKFFRRVATYVVDWQEDVNKGSKDRTPGLGTQPIEPPHWHLKFCEVRDTGLKDFLLSNVADPETGLMPWERHLEH